MIRVGTGLAALGVALLGLVTLAVPTASAATTTAATFVSEPGDYVGQGGTFAFTSVTVASQGNGEIDFNVNNAGDQFTVTIAAPTGQILKPGAYNDIQRTPFRAAGFPGLDVYGDGRGCNQDVGSFTVYDATYDTKGNVVSFAVQFFQHCEGFYSALMGNLSYNSSVAIPQLPATAPEPPQSAQLVSEPGDYLGQGQSYSYNIAFPFGDDPNRQGPNRWELSSAPGSVNWDITIEAPGDAPLTDGTYLAAQGNESQNAPELSVSGNGNACGLASGSFTVYDVSYDSLGILKSFAYEFAFQCIGSTADLYGAIRWNSSVAMPPLPSPESSLTASTTQVGFGNVRVGDASDLEAVTLTNKGGADAVVSSGGLSGPAPDDYFGTSDCTTLAPLASCTVQFEFFPGTVGQRDATALVDYGTNVLPIQLSGTGTEGYYEANAKGAIFPFGDAESYGDMSKVALSAPVVSMSTTPDGYGYWMLGGDGGIFSFGDAQFYGSTGGIKLNKPAIAMASTPDGGGYWLVASDGGIFSFGDAQFYGSTGALALNKPVVGMTPTPDGEGYWLVASDGGIFSFGDAQFFGSTGALKLNKPIVGMAATPDGGGYWLVASDGGIFTFGDASYYGSTGAKALSSPIVGMAPAPDGAGYWLVAANGGIFNFGSAPYYGSETGIAVSNVVAAAGTAPPTIEAFFDVPADRSPPGATRGSQGSPATWGRDSKAT
ncbi:MAG TPA: choice-of-anchor D domain-containing protein [Acidimicrobiales bacterium]|jgi:hypothetical protein|nr:choice-of-anchor D domain-containing protein [Acidimicrobiales bacterium]